MHFLKPFCITFIRHPMHSILTFCLPQSIKKSNPYYRPPVHVKPAYVRRTRGDRNQTHTHRPYHTPTRDPPHTVKQLIYISMFYLPPFLEGMLLAVHTHSQYGAGQAVNWKSSWLYLHMIERLVPRRGGGGGARWTSAWPNVLSASHLLPLPPPPSLHRGCGSM